MSDKDGDTAGHPSPEEARGVLDAPHVVIAAVPDLDDARLLIEDLEEHGVPAGAIALLGTSPEEPEQAGRESDVAESEALGRLAKSTVVGGAVGAVVGGVVGSLVTLVAPDLGLVAAAGLGAVFGAGIGGAAGGISVAKYSSPAWTETYETVENGQVAVGVHHGDANVIDAAEEIMQRHDVLSIARLNEGDER